MSENLEEKYVRVEMAHTLYGKGENIKYQRSPFFASLVSQTDSKIREQVLVFGKLEQDTQHWIISNKRTKTYIPKNTKQYELIEIPKDVFEFLEATIMDRTPTLTGDGRHIF